MFFCHCFLPHPYPSFSPPFFDFSIETETNLAIQVKEAAEKAMEEYRRDHPDVDESAIKVDLPEAPAQKAQGQAVAPGVIPNMNMHAYPQYNPIPMPYANPILGQAHVYPQVQLPPPPQPRHVPVRRRQRQRQPQLPQPAPNIRTRAARVEEQQRQAQQAQQKRQAAANAKAERARLAEQVRIAEEEIRARQRLDRVRDQRAVARREQQERLWLALELQRQREREGQA